MGAAGVIGTVGAVAPGGSTATTVDGASEEAGSGTVVATGSGVAEGSIAGGRSEVSTYLGTGVFPIFRLAPALMPWRALSFFSSFKLSFGRTIGAG